MTTYLHGVEVVEQDRGARPLRPIATGVIGLVGTARQGPRQTPTLIAGSRREAAEQFGSAGTIPRALAGIFDQAGAPVVVVNVLERTAVASQAAVFAGDRLKLGPRESDNRLEDVALEAPAAAATATVGAGAAAIAITAARAGAPGNAVSVALVDPGANDAALAVAVAGQAITVSLATSNAGAVTSTAAEVVDAINGSADAAALATAGLAPDGAPATVVAAVAATHLAGGAEQTAYAAGADYTVDVDAGVVTREAAGAIAANAAVLASYSHLGDGAAADVAGAAQGAAYTGAYALLQAAAEGLPTPRILIAPGWSDDAAVAQALVAVADRLRAIVVADGPDTTDAEAITHRERFGSRRLYLVDPGVKVGAPPRVEPASARVAGVIARTDAERGYWWSPSNQPIAGVVGTARPVDFRLGDAASRANLLNERQIATIIREDGYRLWGNRTCASDPKWQFLSVVRTADAVNEAILRGHFWAVARNITRTYLADVAEGVNAFLRELVSLGAILGGSCWVDPELNTKATIAAGKAVFSFDFTPPAPAERVTFQSTLTDAYLEGLA